MIKRCEVWRNDYFSCILHLCTSHTVLLDTLQLSRRARYVISVLSISHNIYEIINVMGVKGVTCGSLDAVYFSLSASLRGNAISFNARKRNLCSKTGFHAALEITYPDRGILEETLTSWTELTSSFIYFSFIYFIYLSIVTLSSAPARRDNVCLYIAGKKRSTAVLANYTLSQPNDWYSLVEYVVTMNL